MQTHSGDSSAQLIDRPAMGNNKELGKGSAKQLPAKSPRSARVAELPLILPHRLLRARQCLTGFPGFRCCIWRRHIRQRSLCTHAGRNAALRGTASQRERLSRQKPWREGLRPPRTAILSAFQAAGITKQHLATSSLPAVSFLSLFAG